MQSMTQSHAGLTQNEKLLAEIKRLIDAFETSLEPLSQFELGQLGSLHWIKQTIEEDIWGNE